MRLIDADALKEELNSWAVDLTKSKFPHYIKDDADCIIDNAPTIDAVPVVRCKDCKHWDEHSQYGYDDENGVYGNYCMLWTPEDDFYAVETPEDGFCYNGERRDDE